jgi:hypothetical protein
MRIRTETRIRLILPATVVTIAALLQVGAWATACAPNYVTRAGNVLPVFPTGLVDTANIQCALSEATALTSSKWSTTCRAPPPGPRFLPQNSRRLAG